MKVMAASSEEDVHSDNSGDDDYEAHAKLMSDLQSITKKDRKQISSVGLRCLSDGCSGIDLGALQKIAKSLPRSNLKETAPGSKLEEKRLTRSNDFKQLAEDLNKWDSVVQHQRSAKQLTFPLRDGHVSIMDDIKNYKPLIKTDLQRDLIGLHKETGLLSPKTETEEEKSIRKAMSLKEVEERNREAWRLKLFRDKIGKKAYIRNKTKSKKFHRVLKRERLKKLEAHFEKLKKEDPKKALKQLKKLNDIRIAERMSLKHKTSKWAESMQTRSKTDRNALTALQENSRLHQELVQKIGFDDEKKESSSSSESEDEKEQNRNTVDSSDDDEKASVTPSMKKQARVEINEAVLTNKVLKHDGVNYLDIFENESDREDEQSVFDDDDHALEEFNKQKAELEKDPEGECYALPGWGSWAGPDIKMSETTRKKYTIKAPEKPKSKFAKSNVIYNEKADMHDNVRRRMISELPAPFMRMKDFENYLRAPMGRTFVSEVVHRELIKPSVRTLSGTVIKPMDQSELLERPEIRKAVEEKLKATLTNNSHKRGSTSNSSKADGRVKKLQKPDDVKFKRKSRTKFLQIESVKKRKFTRKSVK